MYFEKNIHRSRCTELAYEESDLLVSTVCKNKLKRAILTVL